MSRLFCVIVFIFLQGIIQVSISQGNGSVIKGTIIDMNGAALSGAVITIENTFLGTHTDEKGEFVFRGLKDATYNLRFSFIGYETVVKEVSLRSIAVLKITLATRSFVTNEVIINATRAGEHSPLAYSNIDKSTLRKQNSGHDMPYLLSLTPSFIETSEAGNGIGYTSLRIRGTDGSRINVTIDGIPLNDPESQQVFWVDLPDLASSVENIQVQRGAGTSTNGAGSFGATIDVQTLNPDNKPFAEINTSAGSFNTLKNTIAVGTGLLADKFAVQMRYSTIKSDGYIDRTGSDHRSAFISGIYRTDRSLLKANIILGEEHTQIGWWGVPADMLSVNRRYNPAGEYTDEAGIVRYYDNESDNYFQNHYQLIYSLRFNNSLSVRSALHYTRGKGYYEEYRENQPFSDYGIKPLQIGDSLISDTDLIRRKWLSNDFYGMVYSLKYENEQFEAILGGGINLYLGDHFGKIIWMRNSGVLEKDYRWYFNSSRKGEFSMYGKLNYSLTDKTTIFGDLQFRYVKYNMSGMDDDLKDIGQEHDFGFFNPKTGIFYSINSNQDAYLSFSVANREPSRADYKEASGDPDAIPRPETLYDTELGYKLRTGKSSIGVNLYCMIYKDQLVPTGELSNVGYSITTNVDKSYRVGLEVSASIKLSDHISLNTNATLSRNKILDFVEYYTDYNIIDWSSEYLSKNLGTVDIAYSPSEIWTNDLAINFFRGVDLHLISKYVGKQYFDNTMNPERSIDPYFVNNIRVDLSPGVKYLKDIELQFLVNNILNEKYESNAYGGTWYENGLEKTWSYYFPQAGINYMVRLSAIF